MIPEIFRNNFLNWFLKCCLTIQVVLITQPPMQAHFIILFSLLPKLIMIMTSTELGSIRHSHTSSNSGPMAPAVHSVAPRGFLCGTFCKIWQVGGLAVVCLQVGKKCLKKDSGKL